MIGLTLQIYNWLTELSEYEAAEFLVDCQIENDFIDILSVISGEGRDMELHDAIVFVPLKVFKKLNEVSSLTSKIEDAIRESAESESIIVRQIDWKPTLNNAGNSLNQNREISISKLIDQNYVIKKVRLMHQSLNDNPHLALGTAKELIETCCKSILTKEGIPFERDWDILKLLKETNKAINLVPFEVENVEMAKSSVSKILGGFSSIVHGVTELRNSYGTGHGHDANFVMLDSMYVKLAVTAAGEIAVFYLTLQNISETPN